jgi:iron complex transport system substrate-binding protein
VGHRTLSLLVTLAVAVLAVSCGERGEPLGALPQSYPVTARGAGDTATTLEARPERIVALDPGAAELLAALGVGDRLVGVPAGVDGNAVEVVKPTGQIRVDDVVRLEPDLIVATPTTDDVDASRAARKSGAPLYVQPAGSIEDVQRAALELGFLVGEPVSARQLRSSLLTSAAAVDEAVRDVAPVSVFVDTGFFIPASRRSLLGSLIDRAHGSNVAGDGAGLGPFDLGELTRLDPDVYAALSDSGTTLETLERDPKTRNLRSVTRGRFVELDAGLVTRAGPRVTDAYEAVARALHPDAFG